MHLFKAINAHFENAFVERRVQFILPKVVQHSPTSSFPPVPIPWWFPRFATERMENGFCCHLHLHFCHLQSGWHLKISVLDHCFYFPCSFNDFPLSYRTGFHRLFVWCQSFLILKSSKHFCKFARNWPTGSLEIGLITFKFALGEARRLSPGLCSALRIWSRGSRNCPWRGNVWRSGDVYGTV